VNTRRMASAATIFALVLGTAVAMPSPASADNGDKRDYDATPAANPEATPAVQVDSNGARFELLGDGRWKLTIPATDITLNWATPTDCFGTFYPISERIDVMYWGAEQTCDRPDIHYPQHLDLWLQAECSHWTCWFVDEDYERSPFSEDYMRVTHANGTTPCLNGEERYFRMKVQPTVGGKGYGPYYSSTSTLHNCGV
jgi:hypothetical protein